MKITNKDKARVLDRLIQQAEGMISAENSFEEERNYEEWHLAKYSAKKFLDTVEKAFNKVGGSL